MKTKCPKCGELNEGERTYCWVCYEVFNASAPKTTEPIKTATPSAPLAKAISQPSKSYSPFLIVEVAFVCLLILYVFSILSFNSYSRYAWRTISTFSIFLPFLAFIVGHYSKNKILKSIGYLIAGFILSIVCVVVLALVTCFGSLLLIRGAR